MMRPHLAILQARIRVLLQYRAAAAAGFGTQLFWGFIRMMIFGAFYQSTSDPQPMTYEEVVTYIWLSQAMLVMMPWNVEEDVRELIRSGNVVYEMLRPVELYGLWFSRSLAFRFAPPLLRALPMFVIAGMFLGMSAPPSGASAAAWAAATLGALLVSASLTTLLSVSLLWTVTGEGVSRLVFSAVVFGSGLAVPIPLFPEWLQQILYFLPFRNLVDVPFRLYLGHIPPSQVWACLLHSAIWVAMLILAGKLLLNRGLRRMVIQGG